MHIPHKIFQNNLMRQAAGMVGGTLVALALYGVYQTGTQWFQASILTTPDAPTQHEELTREDRYALIREHAQQILERKIPKQR